MTITNHITKEQLSQAIQYIKQKKIFFILPKDIVMDYAKCRLYVLLDRERLVGSFSLVYEPQSMYYAIKRMCLFHESDKHKGYGSLMLQHALKLGLHPIGMTPWITNPISTSLASKNGLKLQYIFNERYGWWLEE